MHSILSTARSLRARGRRRPLVAPPSQPPPDLELWERAPADPAFLAGNGVASRCRYVLNYGPLSVNEGAPEGWYFCKTDYVDYFFAHHAPKTGFVLFSHNSDYPVGQAFRRHLRRRELRAWFAANVALDHPRLHPLPLGIANPRWPHGDVSALRRVRDAAPPKTRLFDTSFAVETNEAERSYCVEQTGLTPAPRRTFEQYLHGLASSYFCVSPSGNGIDAHRTWEALYVGTVPVVTRSVLTDRHSDLPLLVLDDWSQFRSIDFSPELYERVWGGWDAGAIALDAYFERVEDVLRDSEQGQGRSMARGAQR